MAIDVILRSLLMPVLLGQAFFLRQTVIDLPEPSGAREGKVGAGRALRLLIIGDSSAAGVGVKTQAEALSGQLSAQLGIDAHVSFRLVAKTGARTRDVLGWLPDLAGQTFDVVVTALGVNDVTKLTSARRFRRDQQKLIDALTQAQAARLILVSGLPPMDQFPLLPQPLRWVLGRQAARFNKILDQVVAQNRNCRKVVLGLGLGPHNMARDGFHPDATVYAAWAAAASALLRENQALLDAERTAP